jgi:RHS repeat-associated protein
VTHYGYDEFGDLNSRTLPMGQTEAYAYNAFGELASYTDFNGQVTDFQYDPFGDLTNTLVYPDQPSAESGTPSWTETLTYDASGRMATSQDTGRSPSKYTYDANGNMTQVASQEGTINYAYDPNSNAVTDISTASSHLRYAYDANGRLSTVTAVKLDGEVLSQPLVWSYQYDAIGELTSVQLPTGGAARNTYDAMGRLVGVSNLDSGGRVLSTYQYTLDPLGRRIGELDTQIESDGSTSRTQLKWTYDALGRLTSEISSDLSGGRPAFDYQTTYTYDLVGNLVEKQTTTLGVTSTTRFTYDANDRLVEQVDPDGSDIHNTYDANGNLIESDVNNQLVARYSYGIDNLLTTVTRPISSASGPVGESVTSYQYNEWDERVRETTTVTPDGQPASVVSDEVFLVDDLNPTGQTQTIEVDKPGKGASLSYVYGYQPLAQANSSGVQYFLQDLRGSTRELLGASGAVLARFHYDAYGNSIGFDSSTAPTTLQFEGQQYDAPSQEYYLRARNYDPGRASFTSQDPLSLLTQSAYAFAQDDPIDQEDPTGEASGDFTNQAPGNNFSANISEATGLGSIVHAFIGLDFVLKKQLWLWPFPARTPQEIGNEYMKVAVAAKGGDTVGSWADNTINQIHQQLLAVGSSVGNSPELRATVKQVFEYLKEELFQVPSRWVRRGGPSIGARPDLTLARRAGPAPQTQGTPPNTFNIWEIKPDSAAWIEEGSAQLALYVKVGSLQWNVQPGSSTQPGMPLLYSPPPVMELTGTGLTITTRQTNQPANAVGLILYKIVKLEQPLELASSIGPIVGAMEFALGLIIGGVTESPNVAALFAVPGAVGFGVSVATQEASRGTTADIAAIQIRQQLEGDTASVAGAQQQAAETAMNQASLQIFAVALEALGAVAGTISGLSAWASAATQQSLAAEAQATARAMQAARNLIESAFPKVRAGGNLIAANSEGHSPALTVPNAPVPTLRADDSHLAQLVEYARGLWEAALGRSIPFNFSVSVEDLPAGVLGQTIGTAFDADGRPTAFRIILSPNADGFGWFMDASPNTTSVSRQSTSSAAQTDLPSAAYGHFDLLTVLLHEIGHAEGFTVIDPMFEAHVRTSNGTQTFIAPGIAAALVDWDQELDPAAYPGDLMSPHLTLGVRELPSPIDVQILDVVNGYPISQQPVLSAGAQTSVVDRAIASLTSGSSSGDLVPSKSAGSGPASGPAAMPVDGHRPTARARHSSPPHRTRRTPKTPHAGVALGLSHLRGTTTGHGKPVTHSAHPIVHRKGRA